MNAVEPAEAAAAAAKLSIGKTRLNSRVNWLAFEQELARGASLSCIADKYEAEKRKEEKDNNAV